MEQSLKFRNEGRGGFLIYHDNLSRLDLRFDFEYGGGNCVAIIYIPKRDQWESRTNRSLEHRDTIIKFVAEEAIKEKAPNCIYKVFDDWFEILKPD
jgi:hypothetical protein